MKKRMLSLLMAGVLAATAVMAAVPAFAQSEDTEKNIVSLTTNGLVDPLGIDSEKPFFGWKMESDAVGAEQTAYQIVVTDAEGAVMWDSGLIEDSVSQNIYYDGLPLQPKTSYSWTVSVTDENGNVWTSEEGTFETSFMDKTYESWGDAEWIGAAGKNLDAASADFFDMDVKITLAEGSSKASVIFGADDDRLQNKAFNIWNAANENYFQAEIDLSDQEDPELRLYVVGMPSVALVLDEDGNPVMQQGWTGESYTYETKQVEDPVTEPYMSFPIPAEAVADLSGGIDFRVMTPTINTLTFTVNGMPVIEGIQLNPLGGSHDYNSFPNLCSIGFAVPAGQSASYEGLTLHEYNVSGVPELDGILYDAQTGAGYGIFEGLDGVTVGDDGVITVDGGEAGVVAYADPSFGSAPVLRTEFETADKAVASARMCVTAQGSYEITLNGQAVTDGWFNPGNEEYSTKMPYHVYDVTDLVLEGANAVGAQLGQGWWSGHVNYTNTSYNYYGTRQALLLRLDLVYEDGSTDTVYTSPDTWKVSIHGPVES